MLDRCKPLPPPPLLISLLCLLTAPGGPGLAFALGPFLSFDVLAVRRKEVDCDFGVVLGVAAAAALCLFSLGVPFIAGDATTGDGREDRLGAMVVEVEDADDADARFDVEVDIDAGVGDDNIDRR